MDAGQIILVKSKNITILGIDIVDVYIAIEIWYSENIIIAGDRISNNEYGILLYKASKSMIRGNELINNTYAIYMMFSDYCEVYGNNITNNTWGLYIHNSNYNTIYLNDIISSDVYDDRANFFDNTTYGNYWDKYTGQDLDNDWIYDQPYYLDIDSIDAKPLVYPSRIYLNLHQDPDNDGLTNTEEHYYGTQPLNNDTDDDGLPDGWETSYGLNPLDPSDATIDSDNDGLTNIEEYQLGTNACDSDTDHDNLSDYDEIYVYGTNPCNNDTDNDGFNDYIEILHGTDPLDPMSIPSAYTITTTTITIEHTSTTTVVSSYVSTVREVVLERLPIYALAIITALALATMIVTILRMKTIRGSEEES
ncbi:MAG: hypothetical protein DRN06_09020 [Thermoprotei archaeon]|nr:MAG: hypothetical protein DRN06_09020 [Thermoprotei archaeon]